MQLAMIIVNPSSGKEEAPQYAESARSALQAAGYTVTVRETLQEGDAADYCRSACENGYHLVVSIGGDGTLHEVINGLEHQPHRPKLGIVPLGTVNDFARALRIPLDPEQAVSALTSPAVHKVDVGRMNNRLFINVVAAGPLAESLSGVSSEDKTRLGALAYLKEGVGALTGGARSAHPLSIAYDGQLWEGHAPLFVAALTNSVGGFEKLAPEAAVDDGLLHCYIFQDLTLFSTLTAGLSLLLGNLKNHKDVIYFKAKQVSITSQDTVRTNVDGEEGPPLPVTLSTIPRYIEIIVPEDSAAVL
ncbi:diacylglycerol/lipid kinase family protein [Paenibacillus tengchongensis]|uniref:diacylglycerol/lipid kinase family protein n=1 Tax=Paenibacillus tengchongensis TaxID=2608684 RepID=UPI00124E724F|nr:YegS/Rv2252/BmrU family lipid kinase [Paenibacillus tengchongensis]